MWLSYEFHNTTVDNGNPNSQGTVTLKTLPLKTLRFEEEALAVDSSLGKTFTMRTADSENRLL
jgi:hypothetical protein